MARILTVLGYCDNLRRFETWNTFEFGLMCLFTVGLTTIWKFPYCLYKHSATFLVAFYLILLLVAAPVCWIQLSLGRIYRRGIHPLYCHFMPALKGVSVVLMMWAFIQCITNNVIMSHCLHYMVFCMTSYPWENPNRTSSVSDDGTNVIFHGRTPAEQYYYKEVLGFPGPSNFGPLFLCLAIVCFLFLLGPLMRGAKSFKMVSYVSFPLGLLLLLALTIYAQITLLSGNEDQTQKALGQKSLTMPSNHGNNTKRGKGNILQSQLGSSMMWLDALDLHIFSIGLWTGILPTLGAHYSRKNKPPFVMFLLLIVPLAVLPFLVYGIMSPLLEALNQKQHLMLTKSAQPSITLLFVSLPDAFSAVGMPHVWISLFYLCVILLALHYQILVLITIVENLIQTFSDTRMFRHCKNVSWIYAGLVAVMFVCGMTQIIPVGFHIFHVIDTYLYRLLYLAVACSIPVFGLAYIQINPLHIPIERWSVVGVFLVACVCTIIMDAYRESTLRTITLSTRGFDNWMHAIGHLVSIVIFTVCLLVGLVHALCTTPGNPLEKIRNIFKPKSSDLRDARQFYFDPDEIDDSSIVHTIVVTPSDEDKNPPNDVIELMNGTETETEMKMQVKISDASKNYKTFELENKENLKRESKHLDDKKEDEQSTDTKDDTSEPDVV